MSHGHHGHTHEQNAETPKQKVTPLHDRVLVRRAKAAEVSKGGIIIPDAARQTAESAEVLAVGDGKILESGLRRPVDVKPGDVVYLGKYSGSEITVNGEKLLIIREEDILCVVST